MLPCFGELIATGMRLDIIMVNETVDSILVKEGGVEITFLFHSNCLISQWCFYQTLMIPYIKNMFSSCVSRSFTEEFGFELKTR